MAGLPSKQMLDPRLRLPPVDAGRSGRTSHRRTIWQHRRSLLRLR